MEVQQVQPRNLKPLHALEDIDMTDAERFEALIKYEQDLLPGGLTLDVDTNGEPYTVSDYRPCEICGEISNERVRLIGDLDTPDGAQQIKPWACTPCSLNAVNGFEPSRYGIEEHEQALHMTPEDVAWFDLT